LKETQLDPLGEKKPEMISSGFVEIQRSSDMYDPFDPFDGM
jgi:hypothetical protein